MASDDRLFTPLNTGPYREFESGYKDIELRGINPQFNPETVTEGRGVELRRGYSTDDSLWGTIADVWTFDSLEAVADEIDHTRIDPGATREEFLQTARELLGDYEAFIAFHVRVERGDLDG